MKNLFNYKWIFGVALLALLVGCDGKKGTEPSGSSSSSQEIVVIPDPDPTAAVLVENLSISPVSFDTLALTGSVSVDFDSEYATDTLYLDSVKFIVTTADGFAVPGAEVIFSPFDFTGKTSVDLSSNLKARLDLQAFEVCGDFKVIVLGYAGGKMNEGSVTFTKAKDTYCPELSSSSAEEPQVMFKKFDVLLSTATNAEVAIDLDSKQTYNVGNAASNAGTIDLTLRRQDSDAWFTLGSGAQITYETSGYDGINYPADVTPFNSSFSFKESDFSTVMEEGMDKGSMYIVKTSQFDDATKAGIFAVLVTKVTMIGTNSISVELLIWGKE
ncbi:MAG: hypothetical protein LBR60_08145 [Fibrobacter sp.]|jgi:hypothetical protein|nr:hypothetical protein [Fibrobacter sp.]